MSRQTDPSLNYAPHVREQYEEYPFPLRDPQDELHRLIVSEIDSLAKLNHYCFGGRQRFTDGFRVLVAGGGTGDHTIFIAEQLRDYDAIVTYIDISRASMEIAKERARVRQLDNIEWHHCSILDVASLDLAPFDLISCTGVLHHLPQPEQGLAALRRVLASDGAMSLMVYGRIARMGIYAVQELLRLVNDGVKDRKLKTQYAMALVKCLPETNWLRRDANLNLLLKDYVDNESNLNDALLHEQDRAYSVSELYAFLASAQLELIEFTSFHSNPPIRRYMYDPVAWISDPALTDHIRAMPRPHQQDIAEAVCCVLSCHGFYAAPKAAGRVALPGDPDMVPFFLYIDADDLARHFRDAPGREVVLDYRASTVQIEVGKYSADLLAGIDGSRSMGELFEQVRRQSGGTATDTELQQCFMAFYQPLNALDTLLLRHRSIPAFREYRREAKA
jgi:2-polyprenyl-3-methyl-5-hydroxy-6-metoxy-1,4-benzoquinol methylase